jgi:quinol monooxygenase YgiN
MRSFIPILLAMAVMPLAPTAPALAQGGSDAAVYVVSYIDVAPAAKGQTATLLKQLAAASRKDAGVMNFDVLQRTGPSSNQFVILEAWKDQQALDAHVGAAHSKQFREKLAAHLISPVDERFCIATFIGTTQPARGGGAVHVVTHVDVPGNVRDKAVVALKDLSEATRKDRGNLRFDVTHQKNRTNHFTVMELWTDQKSNDAHELAAHTRAFRDILTPITGALYDQRWYKAL